MGLERLEKSSALCYTVVFFKKNIVKMLMLIALGSG